MTQISTQQTVPIEPAPACDTAGRVLLAGQAESLSAQAQRDFITLLPDWCVLQVSGADAASFLQGQLTCDVEQLAVSNAVFGAHCTPGGRIIANFVLAHPAPQQFDLIVPTAAADALAASLAKYIVFSKASIDAPAPPQAVLGLHGTAGAETLAGLTGTAAPAAVDAGSPMPLAVGGETRVLRMPGSSPRFLVWLPGAELGARWSDLSARLAPADGAVWELLNIRHGLGFVTAATTEAFVPQMLNLPEIGAVSFRKGCYTGQEVIARAHYRGAVKRHLYRATAHLADVDCPEPGATVYAGDSAAGSVVSAIVDDGALEALVVVAERHAHAALSLDRAGRISLTLDTLPEPPE